MRQDLLQKQGTRAAGELNFEMGTAAAHAISDGDLTAGSEEQFWRKIEGYMTSLGWGKPELRYAKIRQNGCEIFTVLVNTSAITQRDTNHGPTCDVIRGVITAWLAERYGNRITRSEETKCTAKGDAHCIFSFRIGEKRILSFRRLLSALL
jgi:predicted hydrocarbon binding protein